MASHTLRRGGLLLLLCASLACRTAALTAMSGWEDGFATFYGALLIYVMRCVAGSALPNAACQVQCVPATPEKRA